jgi:hypothetical protein
VAPLPDGNAAVGVSAAYARADHVHPAVQMNDNRIINGDMRIDQRNNGASGTANGYTVDRWQYFGTVASKGTWGRNLNSAGVSSGFPYYFGFQSSSAYTPGAAEIFQVVQAIEADFISDFAWGTASAQPVTLSFWVVSNRTGTFSGVIIGASTRSYPFTYSISTANTWAKISITIPGDTSGAWVMSGNAAGVSLSFDFGSGATYRGPANAWASAAYYGATGAQNIVATSGSYLYLTGVKLEIGSIATPFNRQSLAKSLADCMRYYQLIPALFTYSPYVPAGQVFYNSFIIQNMRATPTVTSDTLTNVGNCTGGTAGPQTVNNIQTYATATALGQAYFTLNARCSAEL